MPAPRWAIGGGMTQVLAVARTSCHADVRASALRGQARDPDLPEDGHRAPACDTCLASHGHIVRQTARSSRVPESLPESPALLASAEVSAEAPADPARHSESAVAQLAF